MKKWALLTGALLLSLVVDHAQAADDTTVCSAPVRYTLLDGSSFTDDCLLCARPVILQPLHGTFDLVQILSIAPLTRYAVRNLDFRADPGFFGPVQITGSGTFERFEEFALLQDMQLTVQIEDLYTNELAFFTNATPVQLRPFPMIECDLEQTNGTILHTLGMHLVAAPVREVWFSIRVSMTVTNADGSTHVISPGNLLSSCGRVVKLNRDLVGHLGVMPAVPDLGLDAVDVTRHGEILFSLPQDVFSETLGPIQHGDLLSNRGKIVKRNQELLAAFGVAASAPDAGLDAVQWMSDGEILFSIQSNVTINAGQTLSHGDILSDKGIVFRTNRQLLVAFHPAVTNADYGLDALAVLPSGEIWFSLEKGFDDNQLGPILPGDVLSDRGYRVFRNSQLVSAFGPLDPSADYGDDALFVVTGTRPIPGPVAIIGCRYDGEQHRLCLNWDGEGNVFQVECAPDPSGPWEPCSPVLPDLTFTNDPGTTSAVQGFYRVRQW